jgi:hypothetical protein
VFLTTCFLAMAVYRGGRFVLPLESGPVVSGYGEVPETLVAFAVAAFASLVWRREIFTRTPEGRESRHALQMDAADTR